MRFPETSVSNYNPRRAQISNLLSFNRFLWKFPISNLTIIRSFGPTLLHAYGHDETDRRLKRQEIKKTLAVEHKVITKEVFNETGAHSSRKAVLSSLRLYVPGTRRNAAVLTDSNF